MKTREERLLDVAKTNQEPIVVRGHIECDETPAVWATSDGRLAWFTIGEVRKKREELFVENEQ